MEHTTDITRGFEHYFAGCACGWGEMARWYGGAEQAIDKHLDQVEREEAQHADEQFGGTTLGY